MALGKASIKRASAASKKAGVENTGVLTSVHEEVLTKFISKEKKDEKINRPVRLTEEMPTYLL